MRIKFDFRGLRRFVVKFGLYLLGGLLGGAVLGGLAWLLWLWPGGWVGAGLSLLLLAAAALAVRFVVFERKDQGQEVQAQQDQGRESQWRTSKPGIKSVELYDAAYKFIKSGEKTKAEAWLWYCEKTGTAENNQKSRRAFNAAMDRRKKQGHEITQ